MVAVIFFADGNVILYARSERSLIFNKQGNW